MNGLGELNQQACPPILIYVLQVQNVEYGNIVVFRVEIPRRIVAENPTRGKRSCRGWGYENQFPELNH